MWPFMLAVLDHPELAHTTDHITPGAPATLVHTESNTRTTFILIESSGLGMCERLNSLVQ